VRAFCCVLHTSHGLQGPTYGEVVAANLIEPLSSLYAQLFGLVWEGSFMQKTNCKGKDLFFYFILLNPLDGANILKSQFTWFTAKATVGLLPDKAQRLDDKPVYLFDYSISQQDCPDEVSPWGRQKYPFDNPPILKGVIDEARIVGVDEEKRPIQLQRVFIQVLPGVYKLWEYAALLSNPVSSGQ